MLIPKNRGYYRQYVVGGAGIFDSIANLLSSGVAKQLASSALEIGKSAAVDAGKKIVEKGVTKLFKPKSQLRAPKAQLRAPKAQLPVPAPDSIAQLRAPKAQKAQVPARAQLRAQAQNILQKYTQVPAQAQLRAPKAQRVAPNVNSLIDGSGHSKAIAIQDLVRRLNGGGLKIS